MRAAPLKLSGQDIEELPVCSFCDSPHLRIARTIQRAALLAEYEETCAITFPSEVIVSNFKFESLHVLQCDECGTLSFTPTIIGDGAYYEVLSSNLDWYYEEDRWEYSRAIEIFGRNRIKTFLEIGCGDGHFLRIAREHGYAGTGSELNPQSIERVRTAGFEVLAATDMAHHERSYDALVMFQVLEHLHEPYEFLASLLRYVRSGGLIVISTPVRPSCAASVARHVLLLPPHHQSMPTAEGHKLLARRIGCTCEELMFDPPNAAEVEFGIRKRIGRLPLYSRYANPLTRATMVAARVLGQEWVKVGHTILVVLRVE
jgi:SAM-dependent methyltransferase